MGLWYWITTEFEALGWYCVYHGPEFWLVVPLSLGLVIMAALAARDIWRGGKK